MQSTLAPGMVRVFARAGVDNLAGGQWADVPDDHPKLVGWLAAGLVTTTGPRGEAAPAVLRVACCGSGGLGWG